MGGGMRVCFSLAFGRSWLRSLDIIFIMALQPFVGPWPLFQFLDPIHSR
jgi:hypothetical protein